MTLMSDPWGMQQPPAAVGPPGALPPRLARLAEVQATGVPLTREDPCAEGFPRPDELPEVQALVRQGWRALDGAPLYCLLPAAWPPEHRTWVPDRLPRVVMGATTDGYFGRIAPRDDEGDEEVAEQAGHARAAELPAPPARRIWLLRSPWPRIPVAVIYQLIWSHAGADRAHDQIQQMYRTARDLLTWPEAAALNACPAEVSDLLTAWAEVGRVGEAASTVIEHRIRPGELQAALRRTGPDEQTLLAWLDSLQTELTEDALRFIEAWRSAGLPGDPPPGASRFADRDPGELRAWIDAGFDLYAASQLRLAGLETAIRWREAGFSEADTYELLRSDPALTPAEAAAVDRAGEARGRRREWIYYGFNAAQAADWAGKGLTPAQARLWRACGKQPSDVQPGQPVPPELVAGRRTGSFTAHGTGKAESTYPQWESLPDPPGTRGRRARRRSGDADPWINTD